MYRDEPIDGELLLDEGENIGDYDCQDYSSAIELSVESEADTTPFYKSKRDPSFDPFSLYNFDTSNRGEKYVADEIGNDYEQWTSGSPVFITAQTGKRKTTFIVEVLLAYLQKNVNRVAYTFDGQETTPYKVLILSNRIALNIQIKKWISKVLGLHDSDQPGAELLEQHEFGFVTILSYQGLRAKISPYLSRGFTHVIFDECHFFASDSTFNPETGAILKAITTRFIKATRIYMSATMEDCLRYICDYELMARGWPGGNRKEFMEYNSIIFKRYNLERDYAYLNIKWFHEYSKLAEIIKASSGKWLIFMDDINRGKDFIKDQITDLADKTMLVNAGSKGDEAFIEMLKNASLPENKKILVSTSVIDNGVSFANNELENEADHLKNVVIEEIDKVKCLQLVGRIRPAKDETVTLYIKVLDRKDIQRKMRTLRLLERAYLRYDDAYFIMGGDSMKMKIYRFFRDFYDGKKPHLGNATQWFYRIISEPEMVRPNAIAYNFVEILLDRYDSILKEMESSGHGFKYLEHQYSWFDRTFDEKDDPILKRFWDFIKMLPDTIPKKERAEFQRNFEILYTGGYEPKKAASKKSYSMKEINDILKQLNAGVQIEMAPDKRKWIIVKS